ncbi:MAG TPA: sulfatase-like hydrolase/transferase [Caldilineaceae bacterium]|nr:sulfatase-like hydrolase/transferase [Caldilineaceae bacterium]
MPTKKPHILFLINDEHRPDVLPIEGNVAIRTPTLDRFIAQGSYFRNAYTPSPICVPARQSFLSGRYPRNIGCKDFGDPLPSDVATLPGHLSRYGYRAVAAGKMHFSGPDQMCGWHERIGRDIKGKNGYASVAGSQSAKPSVEEGTGKWPSAKEIANARAGKGYWMQHDQYSVDGALMFLDEYFVNEPYDRPGTQPLLLAVSLWCPHYPYQCPDDLFHYYMRRVEPYVEELPANFDCHDFFKVAVGRDVTHREAHRATAAYYGMIEWADAQFGRVIAKLEELNVLDDFVIVFCSDHGEMLGQKGLWEKQQYFEASARVPCFVTWPGHLPGGQILAQNVSLVDLFPTLCDLADVPPPAGLDGRSLLPLLRGQQTEWPNIVYSELYHRYNGPSVMVKQDNLKYFRFEGKSWPEQLFNLATDPHEEHNLINDPAYASALQRLRTHLDSFGTVSLP